jgi:predicted lipid-binding transport protein (Tim44 family)
MRNLCFICSAALIILGAVGYFGWEAIGATKQSLTAAIPACVGIPMLLGGLIALKNNMAGMHIAVLASALGALAGIVKLGMGVVKGDLSGPAPKLVGLMALICIYFTVMAIRSFKAARRARPAGSGSGARAPPSPGQHKKRRQDFPSA